MEDSKQQDLIQLSVESKSYLEWNHILARQLAEWMRIEQERNLSKVYERSF